MLLSRKMHIRRALLGVGFFLSSMVTAGLLAACDSGGVVPTSGGDVGERVYSLECNSCHPGGGRGAGPALIPLLPGLSDAQIREIVRHGKRPMPGFNENAIPDDQLTSLIAYMRTMK